MSGAQLTDRARRQAAKFGAEVLTTRDVTGLEINGSARTVRFADGSTIDAHTVILATGVSYRQLAAPGLGEMTGRGVYYGSALTEAANCKGQDIYIVGGANSAGQAAAYLARHAKSVTILVRGPSLERSMSYYLVQQINNIPEISVRTCTEVIEARGDGHLESITLRNTATGATETVGTAVDFPFHRRGSADGLAGWCRCAGRTGFRGGGPGSVRRGPAATWLGTGPGAVSPGDQRARGFRGRGRAGRVG